MAIIRRSDSPGEMARARGFDPFEIMQDILRFEPLRALGGESYMPTFEVKETKDAYVFKADLPGVKESDLDISLTGNRLTISGQRQQEQKNEGERYFAYERSYGTFSRAFTLPEGVNGDNVQAELKGGVLTLSIPKKPEVQAKKIELTSGSKGGEKAKA
jgi:HSP20 family protein